MTRSLQAAPPPARRAEIELVPIAARQPMLKNALLLFALGMVGLGVLALVYGDFALVWQPVAPWVPGRTALAYFSGVLMLACGVGMLFQATIKWSLRVLFPYLILWTLLKVPALVVAPQIEGVWLGIGELCVLLAGGWVLFARLAEVRDDSFLAWAAGDSGIRIAKILFAVAVIPIGLSHFVYVQQTVEYVPAWLPFKTGWAYLTGAGHIAAGIGVLLRIFPRVAATAEAAMIGVFTLLVWGAAIAPAPQTRMPWTAFFISWVIGAAALAVAASFGTHNDVEG